MFRRKRFSLGNVRDRIAFREGSEELNLTVDESPKQLMAGMIAVREKLNAITDETQDATDAVLSMAIVIFGKEQAEKIFEFYNRNPVNVLRICEKYFTERLVHKIAKAQKKR